MQIRKATPQDVTALVALNRSVQEMHADAMPAKFRSGVPPEVMAAAFVEEMTAPGSYWLVAVDPQPVGFLSAAFRKREESWCLVEHQTCYLAALVVDPAHRRKGIARALVSNLRNEAASRSVAGVELDVWAFNKSAKEAFRRLGFFPILERMRLSPDEPNKALEPTPGPVTPHASSGDLK